MTTTLLLIRVKPSSLQWQYKFSVTMKMTLITLRYKKIILKYTNYEYDHFLCFLAAESESDIRFASSRLDLAVPELWIFAFLLKSEKKFRA